MGKQLVLIMGVANQRSIAWSCVESFVAKNYDCIITYRPDEKVDSNKSPNNPKIEKMIHQLHTNLEKNNDNNYIARTTTNTGRVIGCIPCNVIHDIPSLFQERIPEVLYNETSVKDRSTDVTPRTIDSIVHCLAYMNTKDGSTNNNNNNNNLDENDVVEEDSTTKKSLLLTNASWETYQEAQHISAYSLIETARYAVLNPTSSGPIVSNTASITALSYLGAVRSVPNYYVMGPAKAALEAIIRGLAHDLGNITIPSSSSSTTTTTTESNEQQRYCIRVNGISAGPIKTLSAKGIPSFYNLYNHTQQYSPLGRNITPAEVANTITFLSDSQLASGITGQIIYVDGGYNTIVPV